MDLEEIPWWGWAIGIGALGVGAALIARAAIVRSIAGTSQTVTYKGFTIKVTCGGLSLGQTQDCGAQWQVKVTQPWASSSTFYETVTADTSDAAIAAAKAKIDLYDSTTVPA